MHAKFIGDVNAAALLDQLIGLAFSQSRTPRSEQYKIGVRAVLAAQVIGQPMACDFVPGSAAFDAFHAGAAEGRLIWAQHLERQLPKSKRPANAMDLLAAELLHARQIICVMLNVMDDDQKRAITRDLDAAELIECGTVRNHERDQALIAAGYILPQPIPMPAVKVLKSQRNGGRHGNDHASR
jgi:hypothetical protein